MNLQTMQRIDFYVGVPLCWVLSMMHRLWVYLFGLRPPVKPQRVLCIELSEMGSAFLAYPALRALERQYPGAELYFLIFERNRESIDLIGAVPHSNVITIKDSSLPQFFLSTAKALLRVWSARIDTVIDLELFSRCTALLTFLSGASNRVGFYKFTDEGLYRGSFLTHRVLYNNLQHMSLNFLALALALREQPSSEPMTKLDVRPFQEPIPQLRFEPRHREQLHTKLQSRGVPRVGSRLVLFNPDPGLLTLRGWAIENYITLGRELLAFAGNIVIGVIGLPRSQPFARAIQDKLGRERVIDLTGVTDSMFELAVLFHDAELLIGSDSGPAHLSSLTPISSITLFGPETPVRYAPLSTKAKVMTAGLACSPCYSAANHRRSSCTDNRCMREIAPHQVLERSRKVLEQAVESRA